jgi:uncharacterized protein (TIGR01244 family)
VAVTVMRAVTRTIAFVAAWGVFSPTSVGSSEGREIENFFRVSECVSTGAKLSADQVGRLHSQGVRGIVDLRELGEIGDPHPSAAAAEAGIRYVSIPVHTAAPNDEQARAFLAALEDQAIYPVFLTCGSGNRVGAFWMIRRMVVDGWPPQDAEKEARQIGLKSPHLVEFARSFASRHRDGRDWPVICRSGSGPRAPVTR